jgi:predicted secreted protein
MHLAAAQEVSSIIARAIQEAESDGTYSITFGVEGAPSC